MPDEIRALVEIARRRALHVHMDGARFANALATLALSPAEATWKAGIDIMSFGATKNGALAAEAVIVFDPALARDLAFRRKRAGHLLSKMRFVSAQLRSYLDNDLWLLARRACKRHGAPACQGFRRDAGCDAVCRAAGERGIRQTANDRYRAAPEGRCAVLSMANAG